MNKAAITGTGFYAPEKIVKNDYFDQLYGRDMDTFLREKRNIFERRYMSEDQATSDLIIPAAEMALKSAGIAANDLDLIITATDTPDYLSPSTSSVVQYKLGAKNAGTFDLNSACAGFVTALDTASKFIAADLQYKNILVNGAYGMSKYINWDDYKIASLFADGAGSVVVQAVDKGPHILAATMYSDGQYHDYMGVYGGGTKNPVTHEMIENKGHLLDFAKKIPIETNGKHWPRLTRALLDQQRRSVDEVKHYFITQINIGSIHETLDKLGVNHSLSHNVMDRYGYTGSACIPMAIADAKARGQLQSGDLCVLLGSGGGLSMCAMLLEWH